MCRVVAIKIFDLDVKFEVRIRYPGEDIKWASGFLELNAEVKAKHIHFGVTDIWTR